MNLTLPEGPVLAKVVQDAVRRRCGVRSDLKLLLADVKNSEIVRVFLDDEAMIAPGSAVHV